MTRNPFMVEPLSGSPVRGAVPQLSRFHTNNSGRSDGTDFIMDDVEEDYDHSKRFQGLPQSPSKAAIRYSPDRRHRTQFYRDSAHNSPVAERFRSPQRPANPIFQVNDYDVDTDNIISSYQTHPKQQTSIPTTRTGNLFGGRNYSQNSKYTVSTASTVSRSSMEDEKKARYSFESLDDQSTIILIISQRPSSS